MFLFACPICKHSVQVTCDEKYEWLEMNANLKHFNRAVIKNKQTKKKMMKSRNHGSSLSKYS